MKKQINLSNLRLSKDELYCPKCKRKIEQCTCKKIITG